MSRFPSGAASVPRFEISSIVSSRIVHVSFHRDDHLLVQQPALRWRKRFKFIEKSSAVPVLSSLFSEELVVQVVPTVVVLVSCTTICRARSLDNVTFREAEQGGLFGRVENRSALESRNQEASSSITKFSDRS